MDEDENIYDYIQQELLWDGKLKEAEEALDAEGSPLDIEYHFFKADIYTKMGKEEKNPEKALEYYNKVVEIVPNWGYIYYLMGLSYFELKNYEQALTNLHKSIQLFEYLFPDGFYAIGCVFHIIGEKDNGKQFYERACKLNPDANYKYYKGQGEIKLNR